MKIALFYLSDLLKKSFIFVCLLGHFSASAKESLQVSHLLHDGDGLLVINDQKKILVDINADEFFVPASTLKVATSLVALDKLGSDYRFKTSFYLTNARDLYVYGQGDPLLISEEFPNIVSGLIQAEPSIKEQGIRHIYLDDSFFLANLQVPGVSHSLNPYDALNQALAANFNTIYIKRTKAGEIESAEPQTPMTELTQTLAKNAPVGLSRVNLATHPKESVLYVGYLLKAFLKAQQVLVSGIISQGTKPKDLKPVYIHQSSQSLTNVVQSLLKYSTNFTANQVFLTLGAEILGAPATLEKSKQVMNQYLREQFMFEKFNIEEGAGLSRQNQLTLKQLCVILKSFDARYRALLPEKFEGIYAKTGTLSGLLSLLGVVPKQTPDKTIYFAFVITHQPTPDKRAKIARMIAQSF